MRMKSLVVTLIIFFCSSILRGQVDLQSGNLNYDISFFDYKDNKSGLSTSVGLGYDSDGGIRVSKNASSVGQNWFLIAGGYIGRNQNGEPDDQKTEFPIVIDNYYTYDAKVAFLEEGGGSVNDYYNNYFPNGFMYSEYITNSGNQLPKELAFIPIFKGNMDKRYKMTRRALADREQDVFVFSFNGYSGQFVIGRDKNIVKLDDNNLKIAFTTKNMENLGIRTRIDGFTITDPSGIIYVFKDLELDEVCNVSKMNDDGGGDFVLINTGVEPIGKFTVQKWLLTEVISPINDQKIVFQYQDQNVDYLAGKDVSYNKTDRIESIQIFHLRSKSKLKRLNNILLPDNHKISFNYNYLERVDMPSDYALKSITKSYNNEIIDELELEHDYFYRNGTLPYNVNITHNESKPLLRLALRAVQKKSFGKTEPKYEFDYYRSLGVNDEKDIVPPRLSFSQDAWGYYNKSSILPVVTDANKGQIRDFLLNLQNREIFIDAAKLGLLKSIKNPYGGLTIFEYEQNRSIDTDNPNVEKNYGGVRVSKVITKDIDNSNPDIVTTYKYTLENGATSGWGYESAIYGNSKEIKVYNPGSAYKYGGFQKSELSTSISKVFYKTFAKKVLNTLVAQSTVKAVRAGAKVGAAATGSSIIMPLIGIVISLCIDGLFNLANPYDYMYPSNIYLAPLNSNMLPLQYSRVEVSNSSLLGGIGKEVSEFSRPGNIRQTIPALLPPFSSKQRFATWKYGIPTTTTIFDNNDKMKSQKTFEYNFFEPTVSAQFNNSAKFDVSNFHNGQWDFYSSTITETSFQIDQYTPLVGRALLRKITEKNISNQNVVTTNISHFDENVNKINFANSSKDSKKNDLLSVTYFVNDYSDITPAIAQMRQKNMINIPIATFKYLLKNGIYYLLDGVIDEHIILNNGEIRIGKKYTFESKTPLVVPNVLSFGGNQLVPAGGLFKLKESFLYDNVGALVQMINSGGQINSKIYDYNQRLLVAEVINADMEDIAYTSFETNQGNRWTYDNTSISQEISALTGKKYFTFSNNFITGKVNINKKSIVSFWATKNSNINISNAVLKNTGATIKDWTYFEYEVSNTSIITISGSGSIDELRCYPTNAKMSTTAYDATKGKTSICDINNRVMYYEYDNLGNLVREKDSDGNILKTYEYHFKNN